MTRRANPDAIEKEARLQQAIAAYKNQERTAADAIRAFNVASRTFYRRLSGIPTCNLAHEEEQLLSHIQERELVRWISRLAITGYPLRYATLIEIADIIRRKRYSVTLASTTSLAVLESLITGWATTTCQVKSLQKWAKKREQADLKVSWFKSDNSQEFLVEGEKSHVKFLVVDEELAVMGSK